MFGFKSAFSLSSFTFIKRLFSSSSLSAIGWCHLHIWLLIFLQAILISACASSILAFCMMYSAYKLNKQVDNVQPWCTPFPTWNQSIVPCPVLTVSSWPAYRFLRRQVRWSGIFQFVVIHIVKGFSIVNEADVVVFLEFSSFFYDPTDVGNLISGSSAFSKSSLYIWNSQFTCCWSLTWRILSIIFLACEISSNCAVVWTFFGIALL